MQHLTHWSTPVTKFEPPRRRPEAVTRPDLIDELRNSVQRVVLVTGPAGSGKSVLAADWYRAEPSALWISLDDTDNDPGAFIASLVDGVDQVIPGAGTKVRQDLAAAGGPVISNVVATVVNTLAEHGDRVCVFLDDVSRLENEACIALVDHLAQRLPERCRLIVTSRAIDPFAVAKLRAQGELLELGAHSLAMPDVQAEELFSRMGINISTADVAELNQRVEGWIAGLVMAAQAMQHYPDSEVSVDRFGGSDRDLAGYLVNEVIERLSPVDRTFLLRTSILEHLNGDLCDKVSGLTGGAVRLEKLEHASAFVIPLDRQRRWYRYHHLFSELLLDLLVRQHPDDVKELHRRAFDWYRNHDMGSEAIFHALAAGMRHEAALVLAGNWYSLANSGRIVTARRLLNRFSADEISAFQPLAIAAVWIKGVTGDPKAHVLLESVEDNAYTGSPPDGSASMTSAIAIARSVFGWNGVAQALADAELAYRLEPDSSPWRFMAAWLIADRHIFSDEWAAAKPFLDEVVAGPADQNTIRALAFAMLALRHLDQGEVSEAREMSDTAYRLVEDSALEDIVAAARVHTVRALVGHAEGDLAKAEASVAAARAPTALASGGFPLGGVQAQILLARAALAVGDLRTAQESIARARVDIAALPDVGALALNLERLRTELARAGGITRRELDVVELLPTEMTTREIADELFVSRNTIKTRLLKLYRKLGVSTRSEAVVELQRLGLLQQDGERR